MNRVGTCNGWLAACTLVGLAALGGCTKEITVTQYPAFYTPDLKSMVVVPFQNGTKDPAAGQVLADKLADDPKHFARHATIRQTVVEHLAGLCGLLPRLNLTADPALESMRREVERDLAGLVLSDMTENPAAQAAVRIDADRILSAMSAYMGSADADKVQS